MIFAFLLAAQTPFFEHLAGQRITDMQVAKIWDPESGYAVVDEINSAGSSRQIKLMAVASDVPGPGTWSRGSLTLADGKGNRIHDSAEAVMKRMGPPTKRGVDFMGYWLTVARGGKPWNFFAGYSFVRNELISIEIRLDEAPQK